MANGLTRRSFVGAAGALIASSAVKAAQRGGGQVAPASGRTKGPLVWLDMDQKELDDAYNQIVYAPNMPQVLARSRANSEAALARLGTPRRFVYGPTADEGLDVYVSKRRKAPVHIFLHGGGWRGRAPAREGAFLAESFVNSGAHFIAVDFVGVEDVGGNLMVLADQTRRAVAWTYRNAAMFGGDPTRLFLSGHSSGAHLAAVALTTNWPKEFDLPADVVKAALCCSGMYDLKPVRLSARSSYINFTDEIEEALSPQRHLDAIGCPLIVAHGTLESPEFRRQAHDFAMALKAGGKAVQLVVGDGYNHFEMMETLGNPFGVLGRIALQQMKLTG